GRYVERQLTGWTFFGERSRDAACPIEMTPVLVKQSTFEVVDRGCFWLSDTPSVAGSRSWDSAFARVATGARVQQRSTARALVFLNVHVDYSPGSLGASGAVLRAWMREQASTEPLVVTGDFNADAESALYRDLTCEGLLFDVYRRANFS